MLAPFETVSKLWVQSLLFIKRIFILTDETKAQYGWRLIRQCVKEAIDLSLKADMKEMLIVHGIHHQKQIMHIEPIQQMIYNKNTDVCKINNICKIFTL